MNVRRLITAPAVQDTVIVKVQASLLKGAGSPMSALGQKQTCAAQNDMSALPLKADKIATSESCIPRTAKSPAQFKIELVSTSRLRKTGIFQIRARDFHQRFQILLRYSAHQRLGNTEKAPNVRAFSRTFGTNITRAELGARRQDSNR
jgi:hypothetical protein